MISRTIFVLDHSNSLKKFCQSEIAVDSAAKLSGQINEEDKRIRKSLWSLTAEAVVEYCRILFEINSKNKPVWNVFLEEGAPNSNVDSLTSCSKLPGLSSVESLVNLISDQSQNSPEFINARIIYVGTDIHKSLKPWVKSVIDFSINLNCESYQSIYLKNETLYQVMMKSLEKHFDLASTLVQDIPMKEEANVNSGSSMYGVELIHSKEVHGVLKSVGLLNSLLVRAEKEDPSSDKLYRPCSGFSQSVGVKWVTPKATDSRKLFYNLFKELLRYAVGSYPVTMATVGHRASVCLAQFVLGGRSVALAHPFKSNNSHSVARSTSTTGSLLCYVNNEDRNISCSCTNGPTSSFLYSGNEVLLLTCHGSLMYIHVLATSFSLAHPPLVPLVAKSLLTQDFNEDYLRKTNFVEQLLKPSRLAPASDTTEYTVYPKDRALNHLKRVTKYWPSDTNGTYLHDSKTADLLWRHLSKEYLEVHEVKECTEAIGVFWLSLKNNSQLIEFFRQAEKIHKKSTAFGGILSRILDHRLILQAFELNHLILRYCEGAPSPEHDEVRQNWAKSVRQPLDNGGRFKLRELIDNIYSQMVNIVGEHGNHDGAGISTKQTDATVLGARNLKLLLSQLDPSKDKLHSRKYTSSESKSEDKPPANNSKPAQRKRIESKSDNVTEADYDISYSNPNEFLNCLLYSSRWKPKKARVDFDGALASDAKGFYNLYPNIQQSNHSAIPSVDK